MNTFFYTTLFCYYEVMDYPQDNVFQKILDGTIPTQFVYQDADVVAFKDIAPKAPTHILVIPYKKIACFADLCQEDVTFIGTFFQKVHTVAEHLNIGTGYTIRINQGKDGGQEVFHLHAHILSQKLT